MATRPLNVTVRGAQLKAKITTFCEVSILDADAKVLNSQKTKDIKSAQNPVWEQKLTFDVGNNFGGLIVECIRKRTLRSDKALGQCTIKINPERLDAEDITDEWFPLKKKDGDSGKSVQLRIAFAQPRRGTAAVAVAPPPVRHVVVTPVVAAVAEPPQPTPTPPTTTSTTTTTTTPTPATTTTTTTPAQPDVSSSSSSSSSTTTTTTSSSSSSSSTSTSTATPTKNPPVVAAVVKIKDDDVQDLKRSTTWQDPQANEDLLRKSYVIIDEKPVKDDVADVEDDDADDDTDDPSPAASPATRKPNLRTSSHNHSNLRTSSHNHGKKIDLRKSFAPVDEDEDGDNNEDVDMDGEDEDYDEDAKDYAWDMDEEEEPQLKPTSLTTSGIFKAREATITKTKDILGVPAHIAQALLQFYQWDEEKFLMRFLENPAAIYKESKIDAPHEEGSQQDTVDEIVCSVCFEDNQDQITALSCHHYFCNACWATHVEVAIKEGRAIDITCMQHKCKEIMPEYIVRKVVTSDMYEKYARFLSKSFVEQNANVRWCPKAGCTNAMDMSQCIREGKCIVAKCECGYKFCFLCSEEAHTPATCDMMKEWAKKCADDSETYNWIASNTKDCPNKKCGVPIEKNDGCFMMTCQKCRQQFCWLCSEPWSTHNDHFKCNKFNGGKLENRPQWMDGKGTDARTALDRYLFYYNRYINHQKSLGHEAKTREKVKIVMDTLQTDGVHSYIDVQFIEVALNQLLECRKTLKNTYVYAFYQADPLKKDLFEFSQAGLEKITEDIAQKLLNTKEELINNAHLVKSLTQVAHRSLNNLLFDENL